MFRIRLDCAMVAVVMAAVSTFIVGRLAAEAPANPADNSAQALVESAKQLHETYVELLRNGHLRSLEEPYIWSLRWMNAEKRARPERVAHFAATRAHLERMRGLEAFVQQLPNNAAI